MKQIIFLALVGFAACGRLDNLYLPPNQRRYSSGIGSGQYTGSSGQYSRPTAQYSGSAGQYSAAQQIPILRLEENNNGDGTYSYVYETANGIAGQEQGDARGDGTRAQGGFSYTSPDGSPVQLQYTADENGFQPQGAHLPVAPPVPEAIQRSIQKNLEDEARGIVDDGQYRAGTERYGSPQQYGAPQKYVAPLITPQRFNAPNRYVPPAFPTRSQSGYKY